MEPRARRALVGRAGGNGGGIGRVHLALRIGDDLFRDLKKLDELDRETIRVLMERLQAARSKPG
jgi:hypothetical protein